MAKTTQQKIYALIEEDRESQQPETSIVKLTEPRISKLLKFLQPALEKAKADYKKEVDEWFAGAEERNKKEKAAGMPSYGPSWSRSLAYHIEELIALFGAGGEVTLVVSEAQLLQKALESTLTPLRT